MVGDLTEAAVLKELLRHGFGVLRPISGSSPYDLAVDLDGVLIRVQCKTARRIGDTLIFNSAGTDHGHGPRDYHGRADVFGVYSPALDRVFVVPVAGTARGKTTLRLAPARNNQERRTRRADEHDVARWAERLRSAPAADVSAPARALASM